MKIGKRNSREISESWHGKVRRLRLNEYERKEKKRKDEEKRWKNVNRDEMAKRKYYIIALLDPRVKLEQGSF